VGIEAISRGAEFVWFAESARPALAAIRDNLRLLKIAAGYAVEDRGVQRLLEALAKKGTALDVVYLDPPYEAEREYEETLGYLGRHAATLLSEDAVVVAEHAKKKPLAERFGALVRTRVLEQGDAALSFYGVQRSE
jgi:16S rRNA (guanine(966)-N(2))-methyltransferase RsmD